ncbi:MarR family transcriptional regulator [Pokkaliibacter sp. MBI-7]|uniref:MarR family winged helix-turn-helix transcriptional regulator n=1 Tax=Pokkaliibacter sp. MBI-7 TaxID=3040600 RepID=UPI0024473E2C|nr:MarR family transcriptional regulator [Pokkaliibacter sp. MBI-7]MDH2435553.1 MarR family transcriptional regulator [Pokkaliibacter sp. MBI-7]
MKLNDQSIGFLIGDISRHMRRMFQKRLTDSPFTTAQARVLVHLSRNEGLRQVDLAELMEVQPITLARLIDQLSEAGLVERRPDPDDRRAYRLHLLEKATPHLEMIDQLIAEVTQHALKGLDHIQVGMVMEALQVMRNNVNNR